MTGLPSTLGPTGDGVFFGLGPALNIHELVRPRPLGVSGKHSDQRCARVELSDAWTGAGSITPEGVELLTHSQAVNCIMLGDQKNQGRTIAHLLIDVQPDDCPPEKLSIHISIQYATKTYSKLATI